VGGVYRATLVGANGRGWQLFRRSGGGGTRTIRVVDLVAAGGVALPDGPVFATVEAWGWPGFDETRLILTDIERLHDHFAQSGAIQYMQP
jgi:hypothetical protein